MAHVITKQTLVDGLKITTVKINIKGDSGTATELVKTILYDASDYQINTTENKLMRIEYALNDFSAELFWDATTDVPLISLVGDDHYEADYHREGGLINNGGTGRTGDILITTVGLASSVNDGYIILHMAQKAIPNYN